MANDAKLREVLTGLAKESAGRVVFAVTSVTDLGAELGLDLGRSPNPVYDFRISQAEGEAFRAIAYTLTLDGSRRPATRVEALGRGLAAGEGRLFDLNPFLIAFDYADDQFLAVSGAKLFGAFADEVARRSLAASASATFSFSPNFAQRTVSMYASLDESEIWYGRVGGGAFGVDDLEAGVMRVKEETEDYSGDIPRIVEAIQERIGASEAFPADRGAPGPHVVPVSGWAGDGEHLKVPPRVWRMVLNAIRSSRAVILVGPPGTGKTALLHRAIEELAAEPAAFGLSEKMASPLWATPDESWTTRELVGGDTVAGSEIRFRPGWILRAIEEGRWLVLDEANRADMDRIFGSLLTWLSGGSVLLGSTSHADDAELIELSYAGSPESRVESVAPDRDGAGPGRVRYGAGESWRLLGTYNALDAQRVFRFGAALGRRFVRVPVPAIDPGLFREALDERNGSLPEKVRSAIGELYRAHFESEATRLGPAVFLGMCAYIQVGTGAPGHRDAEGGEVGREELSSPAGSEREEALWREVLAEAYVIHVGTWLAHLEERDYEALRQRLFESGTLSVDWWSWVAEMTRSLA